MRHKTLKLNKLPNNSYLKVFYKETSSTENIHRYKMTILGNENNNKTLKEPIPIPIKIGKQWVKIFEKYLA